MRNMVEKLKNLWRKRKHEIMYFVGGALIALGLGALCTKLRSNSVRRTVGTIQERIQRLKELLHNDNSLNGRERARIREEAISLTEESERIRRIEKRITEERESLRSERERLDTERALAEKARRAVERLDILIGAIEERSKTTKDGTEI